MVERVAVNHEVEGSNPSSGVRVGSLVWLERWSYMATSGHRRAKQTRGSGVQISSDPCPCGVVRSNSFPDLLKRGHFIQAFRAWDVGSNPAGGITSL